MKKSIRIILSLVLTGSMAVSAACSSAETSPSTEAGTSQTATATDEGAVTAVTTASGEASVTADAQETTDAAADQTTFTLEELKAFDGQNGNKAYVAIEGVVYDVTEIKEWKDGQHQGLSAGNDLTADLASSPHGTTVLGKLTQVGTLVS